MFRRRSSSGVIERLEVRYLLNSYFVDPAGSDAAAGTTNAPWATLQHAAVTITAGDTIIVRAGEYAGFVMGWDFPNSGTAAKPIVWQAEPGAVIVTPNNKTPDGIDIEQCDYVVIDGFTVRPQINSDGWRSGIRIGGGGTGDVLRNNIVSVRMSEKYGIFSSFTTNLLVEHNTVTGSRNSAIYTSNSAVRPTVRDNTISDAGENGLHFNGDVGQGGTGIIADAIIEGNIISNTGQGGGSAINCDGIQNSVIQNNLLFDNHGKGIALYQIDASAPSINNEIVNNTVVMADGSQYALTIKDGSTGNHARNNILLNEDAVSGAINISPDSLPSFVSNYNVVTPRFTLTDGNDHISLATWQATTGQGLASSASDPALVFVDPSISDFHLASGSPAIDAGTASQAPPTDLENNARPAGARYDVGAFEYGAVGTPAIPTAPSGLVAVSLRSTQIVLTWLDNANNESGYTLERSTTGDPYLPVAWLNPNSARYVDIGLVPDSAYSYRVYATNSFGDSDVSNSVTIATLAVTAPDSLAAIPASYTSIGLSWNDADAAEVAHYNVYRDTTVDVPTDAGHLVASSVTVTLFVDPTVTPGTGYYYRITAVSGGGAESTPSNVDGTNTVPNAPSDLTASVTSTGSIELDWTVADSSALDHFNIYRSTSPISASATLLSQKSDFTFIDTSAQPNTTYYYYVTEVNVGAVESNSSNIASIALPPPAPVISAATVIGSSIQIRWSYGDLAEIDHFNVYRSESPKVLLDATHRIGQTTNLQINDNTADGTRKWYYVAAAVNLSGVESVKSNLASAQFPTAFAALDSAGVLTITGTSGVDLMYLGVSGAGIQFTLNSVGGTYDVADVDSVVVNALSGNDTLQLDDLGTIPVSLSTGGGSKSRRDRQRHRKSRRRQWGGPTGVSCC